MLPSTSAGKRLDDVGEKRADPDGEDDDGANQLAGKPRPRPAVHGCRDLEELGWQALAEGRGAEYYQHNLADSALMVFPFGVLDREGAVESIRHASPWTRFHLEGWRLVELTQTSAILSYRATAHRHGQAPYTAWLTTVFVRQAGTWKVAFHQQTPASP